MKLSVVSRAVTYLCPIRVTENVDKPTCFILSYFYQTSWHWQKYILSSFQGHLKRNTAIIQLRQKLKQRKKIPCSSMIEFCFTDFYTCVSFKKYYQYIINDEKSSTRWSIPTPTYNFIMKISMIFRHLAILLPKLFYF